MLSVQRYVWLCVLGAEVFYVLCVLYGQSLTGAAAELHHSLFALLPGFVWGTTSGLVYGAVDVLVASLIVGWYIVWMHNYSLISKKISQTETRI